MCLFDTVIFEGDASLKWMPWQSKLKSGTCITKKKKKKQLSGLILQCLFTKLLEPFSWLCAQEKSCSVNLLHCTGEFFSLHIHTKYSIIYLTNFCNCDFLIILLVSVESVVTLISDVDNSYLLSFFFLTM